MLKKTPDYYSICCGFILLTGVVITLFSVFPAHQNQAKATEKQSVSQTQPRLIFDSSSQLQDRLIDGQLKLSHPRILLPEITSLTAMERIKFFQNRNLLYKNALIEAPALPCNSSNLSSFTACWIATGSQQQLNQALQMLLDFKVETPGASALYGNGWQLALNYDLLASSPQITAEQHQQIQSKLEAAVVEYLRVLDGNSASLWHGRLSLSSNAWLCAVLLNADTDKRRALIASAQDHFLDTLQSVAITEVWPEGYSYWINNRGFYFALAASAYINGLENSQHADEVKQLLERVGLWHIYATRPDNKIQGYGDEGPRTDLKDETRRVIDIIASTTGNQQLASYSLYLQKLHGSESYFRDYRWGFHLFNNPELLPAAATGSLEDLADWLPKAKLFGRNGSNALYIRSDWGPEATYINYRAGHSFTHHGHYDAGHFTLFKGQPLAVNSSTYGVYTSANRLNYSLRTLAKNSLLIQRPGEHVKPNRFFTDNVAAGGQRMTLPTGSAIKSIQQWQDNLYKSQHLEGAELEQFSSTADYTYIQSDLTPAYNNTQYDETGDGGKVSRVQRALLYLNQEDILLVHDRIKTTNPAYRAKWLLHSLNKPQVGNEQALKGSTHNGIILSTSQQALIQEKQSSLKINVLLPQNASMHLVGGSDYRYYVETDGDDTVLDGKNMYSGSKQAPWFEQANWRTEIFSPAQNTTKHFLVALAPAATGLHPVEATLLSTSDKEHYGALLDTSAVIFTPSRGQFSVQLPASVKRLYLVGLVQQPRRILLNEQVLQTVQHKDIITQVLLPPSDLDKSIRIEL